MTSTELISYLSFDERLEDVEIIRQDEVEPEMMFILADLKYADDTMRVAFVIPTNEDWLFTPCDWHGVMPESPKEIEDIEWRVNDTETPGYIVNGLPRVFSNPPSLLRSEFRESIGYAIRSARNKQGLSLRDLAARCGVNYGNLCRIESGRLNTSLDTIAAIFDSLGISITLHTD